MWLSGGTGVEITVDAGYNRDGPLPTIRRRPAMRTRNKVLLGVSILLVAAALAILGPYCWLRYMYPYGYHRACHRQVLLALIQYAGDHDDKFPSGGATPEASLSMLYHEKYITDPGTLAGNGKSAEVAQQILESGGVLGPDTCDWHYVEGVNHDADATIAIFWDKSGFDHTGRRLHGGHMVGFNDGHVEIIPANRWKEFLTEQEKMVEQYLKWKDKSPGNNPP
jgi:hypothetical protein